MLVEIFFGLSEVMDSAMSDFKIGKDYRHKLIRRFLTGTVAIFAAYGLYLRHIKHDIEFIEKHSLSNIEKFYPIPYLFDGEEAYYIYGTDVILIVDEDGHNFLRISYNLNEDYMTKVSIEDLLEQLPDKIGELIIYNMDRLDK